MVAEADSLVKAAFGPTMLKAIGKTYVSQAEIFLGNFFEGSIAALKSKSSSVKSQMHALGLAIQVSRLTWRLQFSKRKKAGNADSQNPTAMLSGIAQCESPPGRAVDALQTLTGRKYATVRPSWQPALGTADA